MKIKPMFFILLIFIFIQNINIYSLNDLEGKFFDAVSKNKTNLIKSYIKKGVNINVKGGYNNDTALIRAADYNYIETVKLLIESGADVNEKNNNGFTALYITDSLEITELLIKSKADVNAKDNNGRTILMLLCRDGKNYEKIKLLIERGADINVKDNNGRTALVWSNGLEIVKYLVEKGADVNAKDNAGSPVLSCILCRIMELKFDEYMAIADFLIDKVDDYSKNHVLIILPYINNFMNFEEMLKLLIKKGAKLNFNFKDNNGWTALMYASKKGHLNIVEYLIEKGVNINEKSKNGWTALMLASGNNHLEIVKLLVEKGANVNEKDNTGCTALMIASLHKYYGIGDDPWAKIVKYLVENGADINIKDQEGKTALKHASEKGHKEIIEYLKSKGAK